MAAMFGDMGTSMGLTTQAAAAMSTSMVGLAGDLASFKNIQIEEATTALAAVFTGETESLKRLGIVMTEANLKQFALTQGIKKNIKEMTQAEKTTLRYQYVIANTGNAQGDFARTQDGAANQMRIFTESIKEIGANLGQILLPAFTKMVTKVNEALKAFMGLDEGTKKTILIITGIVAAVGPMLIALGQLPGLLSLAAGGFRLLTAAMVANPILAVATAIAAVTTAIIAYRKNQKAANAEALKQMNTAQLTDHITGLEEKRAKQLEKYHGRRNSYVKRTEKEIDLAKEQLKLLKQAKEEQPTAPGTPATPTTPTVPTMGGGETRKPLSGVSALGATAGVVVTDPVAMLAASVENSNEDLKSALIKSNGILQQKANEAKLMAIQFNEEMTPIVQGGLQQMAMGIGSALGEAIANGGNLANALASTVLGTIGDMAINLGKLAISMGITLKGIVTALKSLNPVVAIAAGIALIALGSLVKGAAGNIAKGGKGGGGGGQSGPRTGAIAAFANGGIVSGPTLGLMGEYAGARSNPEVIAPLDKLKNIIGDRQAQQVNVGGEFRLNGQDLVVALQRAEKQRGRIK
jgi:hypothetical protein